MHFAEGVRIISRKLKRRKWKSPKSAFPMLPIYELIWNTPKKTTFTSYTIINYVINVAQLLNICVMKDILLKLVISVCILLLTEIWRNVFYLESIFQENHIMHVNLFFNWLWIGELLTFKTGPPCRMQNYSIREEQKQKPNTFRPPGSRMERELEVYRGGNPIRRGRRRRRCWRAL